MHEHDTSIAHSLPMIIHPTHEDVSQKLAKNLEYLVAFKNPISLGTDNLSYFHNNSLHTMSSTQDHYQHLVENGLASYVEVLSTVDLFQHQDIAQNYSPASFSLSAFLPKHSLANMDKAYGEAKISHVRFSSKAQAQHTLSTWQKSGIIWYAEPNRISQLSQETKPRINFATIAKKYTEAVNDKHIEIMKLHKAMDAIAKLSSADHQRILKNPPVIAIIDSGIDDDTSLKWRKATYPGFDVKTFGCAPDGCNVYRDKKKTYKKGKLGDENYQDTTQATSHGTPVAKSAVGYDSDNHVFGACPICLYLPIKVTDSRGVSDTDLIRAYEFAGKFPQLRVLNASLGKSTPSTSIKFMTKHLSRRGKGMILVAAAGNNSSADRQFPAAYGHFLGVSAIDENYKKSNYSNSGYWVDLAAPEPFLHKRKEEGTSFTAPLVAGIAGLIIAIRPNATIAQVHNVLTQTSDRNALYEKNRAFIRKTTNAQTAYLLGRGVVNAEQSVRWAIKNSLDGKSNNQRGSKRIPTTGCSTLHTPSATSHSSHQPQIWWWILMLPFLLSFSFRFSFAYNACNFGGGSFGCFSRFFITRFSVHERAVHEHSKDVYPGGQPMERPPKI